MEAGFGRGLGLAHRLMALWMVVPDPCRDVWGDTSSHQNVGLFIELDPAEGFREGIAYIIRRGDWGHFELVMCHPILNGKLFCVHVPGVACWLLGVHHVEGAGVVFEDNGGEILGKPSL